MRRSPGTGAIGAAAVTALLGSSLLPRPTAAQALALCANEQLSSTRAPDGRHRAVVFQRDCGAASGYSRQLSILPGSAPLLNERGNVLAFGDREHPDPSAPWVGPQLQLAWRGADTLEVRTNSLRWRSKPPVVVDGVTVVFRPL